MTGTIIFVRHLVTAYLYLYCIIVIIYPRLEKDDPNHRCTGKALRNTSK